jgi:hypothetical protein
MRGLQKKAGRGHRQKGAHASLCCFGNHVCCQRRWAAACGTHTYHHGVCAALLSRVRALLPPHGSGGGTVITSRPDQVIGGVVVKEYQRLPTKLLEELCQKEKRLIPRYSESKRKPGDNPHRFSVGFMPLWCWKCGRGWVWGGGGGGGVACGGCGGVW